MMNCLLTPARHGERVTDAPTLHVVIRSPERKAYLMSSGQWSPRLGAARTFVNVAAAEEECRAEKLRDVEIVIMRPNRPMTSIPVSASLSPRSRRADAREQEPRDAA
jgi:hypothetical protein